jgi:hypothetical protein
MQSMGEKQRARIGSTPSIPSMQRSDQGAMARSVQTLRIRRAYPRCCPPECHVQVRWIMRRTRSHRFPGGVQPLAQASPCILQLKLSCRASERVPKGTVK